MSSFLLILSVFTSEGASVTTANIPDKESCFIAQKTFLNRKIEMFGYSIVKDALCIEVKKDGVK